MEAMSSPIVTILLAEMLASISEQRERRPPPHPHTHHRAFRIIAPSVRTLGTSSHYHAPRRPGIWEWAPSPFTLASAFSLHSPVIRDVSEAMSPTCQFESVS
jgi:hypothetical protein